MGKSQNKGKRSRLKMKKMTVSGTGSSHQTPNSLRLNALNCPNMNPTLDNQHFLTVKPLQRFISMDMDKLTETNKERESVEELSLRKWRETLETNSSIVSDTLMGQLVSRLQCEVCKTYSYNFELFYMLELNIPQNKEEVTLIELLQNWSKGEYVDNFLWDCEKCKTKRRVIKSWQIWKPPPVLIVYLKRFEHTPNGIRKNNCLVKTNFEGEDFSHIFGSPLKSQSKYIPYFSIVKKTHPASFW